MADDEARVRGTLEREYAFVWRCLVRLGVPVSDAEDATQEVFLVFARRLATVPADHERAFLFGTLRNVATARGRQARRVRRWLESEAPDLDELEADQLDPEECSQLVRARPLLQRILDGMSLEQREVFVLREIEDLSIAEIARLLALPIGTVGSRLRIARALFQESARLMALSARRSAHER